MLRPILVVGLLASPLAAAEIRAVGVLGNSGEAGEALLRVTRWPDNQHPTGVAVGDDATIWLGAGDAVQQISLSGERLARFPLEPAGSRVQSRTFAVLGRTLYFLGEVPKRGPALFALAMDRPGAAARPLDIRLPRRKRRHLPHVLCPQPIDGRLAIVNEPPDAEKIDVHLIDPAAGRMEKAFSLAGGVPHGAAYDRRAKRLYVGAGRITAVRVPGGQLCRGFPVACMKTPAIPTQFRGTISLAAGALWDTAWYGFLSRHGLDGSGEPGRVVEWHHELDTPSQLVGLPRTHPQLDPLLITTATPAAAYYAHWDRADRRLRLVRRIGCLPDVLSLGLSRDGWVTAATARCQLWWRWDDPAWAVPRKVDMHLATTPPLFDPRGADRFVAVAEQYALGARRGGRVLAVFPAEVGSRNEARRHPGKLPFERAAGLAARPSDKNRTDIFFSDPKLKAIWQTTLWVPQLSLTGPRRPIQIKGAALRDPTDLAALTDGRLLVADAGRVLMLKPDGEAHALVWELAAWGKGADQHFGASIRMAVDGRWMLVADTARHRLIWLDWPRRRVLAVFGRPDHAGAALHQLSRPTYVSLAAPRAVVADAGNQRILKLVLAP